MSVLTRVLPRMQAFSEGEMPDTVTVHRPGAGTPNEYGALVPGANADLAPVPGRLSVLDATDLERVIAGEMRQEGLLKLTLPLDSTIATKDTLTVVSARFGGSVDYTVESVVPLTSYSVDRKVLVRAE